MQSKSNTVSNQIAQTDTPTIGTYLLQQLQAQGITHVFGVPGDYILGMYDLLSKSALTHIGTTREDTAAFAADGYARCHGLGCLMVTYGVGALNVVNAVAGAYAESSPLIVVSGAPGVNEQQDDPLIHHKFGPFNFQKEIFERITCACEVITDPFMAFRQIDHAIEQALLHSKPVYLEFPRDRVLLPGTPHPTTPSQTRPNKLNQDSLNEAVQETLQLIAKAQRPAILVGVELHRTHLQDAVANLLSELNIPIAATLTGKSVLGERHPAYYGIYEGSMGPEQTKEIIENADLVLILGVRFNDIDLGIYTAQLDPYKIVRASHDDVFIRHHRYQQVPLKDFIMHLGAALQPSQHQLPPPNQGIVSENFPREQEKISLARMMGAINQSLTADMHVVCDVGDCLFAAIDLRVHQRTQFLASAYYTSMGFATPAALGVHCANPGRRALVLVGDGAFQMTGTELSTLARHQFNPIVIVLNNKGYSTERFILEGPFNDIMNWQFHEIGKLFGPINGYEVHFEHEFDQALRAAIATTDRPSILNVHLEPDDSSPAMTKLAKHLSSQLNH